MWAPTTYSASASPWPTSVDSAACGRRSGCIRAVVRGHSDWHSIQGNNELDAGHVLSLQTRVISDEQIGSGAGGRSKLYYVGCFQQAISPDRSINPRNLDIQRNQQRN